MVSRKLLCLLVLVFVAVAVPVTSELLLNYEEPFLEADGTSPPPPIKPIPGLRGSGVAA